MQPTDDGALLLTQAERDDLLRREPAAEPYIKPFSMGAEYINGVPRYCIWMDGADPAVLLKLPLAVQKGGDAEEGLNPMALRRGEAA